MNCYKVNELTDEYLVIGNTLKAKHCDNDFKTPPDDKPPRGCELEATVSIPPSGNSVSKQSKPKNGSRSKLHANIRQNRPQNRASPITAILKCMHNIQPS